jgi:hypothetical protein
MKNDGKDLHGHITKVMSHLSRHTHPSESLQKLEEVSYLIKHPKLGAKYLLTSQHKDYAKPCGEDLARSTQGIIDQAKEHFKLPEQKPAEGEDGQEEEAAKPELVPIGFLPDLRSDSRAFEWAGISFGEYDTMLLQKNMQKHIAATGAS